MACPYCGMQTEYRHKMLIHIARFHFDEVERDGPDVTLNRVWWRCKAGNRRISVEFVSKLINDMGTDFTADQKATVLDIVAAALNLTLVRIASDSSM